MRYSTRRDYTNYVPSVDVSDKPIPYGSNSKFKKRNSAVVRRDPSTVNGIVLHQTAVVYSVSSETVASLSGNKQLALAYRAKKVACHALSFEGFYAKLYPLDWYVYHANRFNRKTLGLEIEGKFPGLTDDLSTLWKGSPTVVTRGRIEAAHAALSYLVEDGRKMGMPIKYLYAHRQSKGMRRSDPGEELWRKVALEYGVPVLGLETRPLVAIATGKPIPKEWDPQGYGSY